MADVAGFFYPRTATGRASLLPAPPWYYSGDMLTVEYRTDPARVAELLPHPLAPAPDDPGAVALIGLAFFVIWELTEDKPIVDLRLFAGRNFLGGTVAISVAYAIFFANLVILPQWIQEFLWTILGPPMQGLCYFPSSS